ncbi:hypothetical protein GCM10027447_27360 [Glycomyces halotolerans]
MTAGLIGAIAAGSVMAALTGPGTAADASLESSSGEATVVRASWKVDRVIDAIDAEREAAQQAKENAEAAEKAVQEAAEEAAKQAEVEEAERQKAEEEAKAEAEAQAAAEAVAPEWLWPSHDHISSHYGPRWGRLHAGMDFANEHGDPIWAIGAGEVVYSGWMSGYGNFVVIDHGGGLETAYAHASELLVGVGDRVEPGDQISVTGTTGNSTAPHLHFEVRVNGQQVDPYQWLAEKGVAEVLTDPG